MGLQIPYGIDPDETWELDFVEASARRTIGRLEEELAKAKERAEKEKDEKKRETLLDQVKAAEDAKAKLETDLAGYTPGTGPIFTLGPIPNGKRAELLGETIEVERAEGPKEAAIKDTAWAENVVRWSVRGHRNLKSGKSGKALPFHTEKVSFAGEEREVVARKTLEAYGRFLGDLALVVLRSQRIDEAGKNV